MPALRRDPVRTCPARVRVRRRAPQPARNSSPHHHHHGVWLLENAEILYTISTNSRGVPAYNERCACPSYSSATTGKCHPPKLLRQRYLWAGRCHLGGPGVASGYLPAVSSQRAQGGPMGRDRRRDPPGGQFPHRNDVSPQSCGRVESDQRKGHGVGGEACRQFHCGLRPAMHPPGMRLPLGRREERIHLSLPQLLLLHRRQRAGRPCTPGARPL